MVSGVEIGVSAFMVAARALVTSEAPVLHFRVLQGLAIVALGVIGLAVSRTAWAYPRARALATVSGCLVAAILIAGSLLLTPLQPHAAEYIPAYVMLVLLVLVAAVPLTPIQTLSAGCVAGGLYVVLALTLHARGLSAVGLDATNTIFLVMLVLLTTVITGLVYSQRWQSYEAYKQTLRATDDLRQAQSRVLLSENAASLARLAAALSHELNSPLGALTSSVDTLLLLSARQAASPSGEQPRLVNLQADLRTSVRESAQRLKEIVARMQRFTNLDRAEVQEACINDLLTDAAALMEAEVGAKVRLQFSKIPLVVCRPHQLSAVFSSLLSNALHAASAVDGASVAVHTRQAGPEVEVVIEDTGPGVSDTQIRHIFEPGFKVTDGRVTTGNWSMFSARQIIREHGGEIEIFSAAGKGTRVRLALPVPKRPGVEVS